MRTRPGRILMAIVMGAFLWPVHSGAREGEREGDGNREGREEDHEDHEEREDKRREVTMPFEKGIKGFSGVVRGEVKSKLNSDTFIMSVKEIGAVGEANQAPEPWALNGRDIKVAWGTRQKEGRIEKDPMHARYISQLNAGDRLRLEVRHLDKDQFQILELNEEQRKIAGGGKEWGDREGHGEGERRPWARRGGEGKGHRKEKGDERKEKREGARDGQRKEVDGKPEEGEKISQKTAQEVEAEINNDYDD